jgi:atypical dual specificity phosphatase
MFIIRIIHIVKKSLKSLWLLAVPPIEMIQYRWIIPHQLAVGPLPDAEIYQQLKTAGIQAVLSLCAADEGEIYPQVPQEFLWERLVLPDSHYEERMQVEQLAAAVAIVDKAISQHLPIYVHCLAGMERSPTVCIAYLCAHQGLELWEALNWVQQYNRRTSLQSHQLQVLQEFVQQQAPQETTNL